jgi:hypothetical protein
MRDRGPRINSLSRKLLFLIPAGIIANVVYCLVSTDRQLFLSVVHYHPGYLIGAALMSVVPWVTGSLRLFTWSRFFDQPVPYREAFGIVILADLGAAIAPPLIGGGAVKAGMLMSRGLKTGTALSLPVLENLEDGLFFLIMVPFALLISSSWALLNGVIQFKDFLPGMGAGLLVFVVILIFFLLYGKRQGRFRLPGNKIMLAVRTFLDTFRLIGQGGKKVLVLTLALTAVQWVCRYSIISMLLAGLGIPVRPVLFMVLQVLVFALTTFVPSPGGAGGAEIFFALLYNPLLPPGTLGLATTGWRFFTFYFHTLLAAMLFLVFGRAFNRERSMGREFTEAASDTAGPVLLTEETGL